MKLFNKKEEKNKIGRPKLADTKLKKKSIIMSVISLLLVVILLGGSLVSFNIVPRFNKLKGTVNVNLCSEIPAKYQPKSESNSEGTYEYGFTDPKFYSAVVSTYNNDASYCSTITEDELRSITNLSIDSRNIDNADGVQYLTSLTTLYLDGYSNTSRGNLRTVDVSKNIDLKTLNLSYNNLSSVDVSKNIALTYLSLYSNSLSSIDLSQNTALTRLDLSSNNLSSIDLSQNTALTRLGLNYNNISNIDVSKNTALTRLDLSSNNLSSIDVSKNTALTNLYLDDNNISSIDLSQNTALTYLYLDDSKFQKTYSTTDKSVTIEKPNIITAYPNDVTYDFVYPSVATYNNGIVERINPGNTTLRMEYKISDFLKYNIDYGINFIGITSSRYVIDEENKQIDLKDTILEDVSTSVYTYFTVAPSPYRLNINNNILEILDSDKKVVNSYEIINMRQKDEDAYLKAGFKDKKFYTCVVKNRVSSISEGNYLLTELEMKSISRLSCSNQNISNVTGIEKLTNLTSIDLSKNNIESINLENNKKLNEIVLFNNQIEKIAGLNELPLLNGIVLDNNKLQSLNLSKASGLVLISLGNNPLSSTLYILKDTSMSYKNNVQLNSKYSVNYTIEDQSVASFENGIINALKVGDTNIKLSTDNIVGVNPEILDKCYVNADKNVHYCNTFDTDLINVPYYLSQVIKVYDVTSDTYKIDKENKTIDVKELYLDINKINITNGLTKVIDGDNFVIKFGDNIVDTFKLKNYKSYNLRSSYYTIDYKNKTIDLNGEVLNNVSAWKFNVNPYGYTLNINNDKLEIKDSSGIVVDTYEFKNYLKYKLTSTWYHDIDDVNKTVDVNGEIPERIFTWKFSLNPSSYYLSIKNNILEILDSDKNVIDSYEIINMRQKDEDAYLKAGFKDKNLYTCVVKSYHGNENIEGNYLLTDEEMKGISSLSCVNKNISDTTGIDKLTNLSNLDLSYNNITSINLENNTKLENIFLLNNKLTNLDVSKNLLLGILVVANNKIEKITGLNNLESLSVLMVYNNNLSSLNLSKSSNIEGMIIDNNPLSNTLYMLKGSSIDYKDDIKLNSKYKIAYDIANKDVVSYKGNILKALKEGITNIYLSTENIYVYKSDLYDKVFECDYLQDEEACTLIENTNEEEAMLPYFLSQEIKVYDVISKEYKVDKEKKVIDVLNKDFDASKINITLNGLTGVLENDKFIIKDGETIVDTYTIINIKKVIKEEVVSNSNNGSKVKASDKVIEKIEERKEKAEEKLEDIIIKGDKVPLAMLLLVKGKDRNIVITNEALKFTINGKDIDKVTSSLDLSYELNPLKESTLYSELKDKIKKGIVLNFKDNVRLPYKVLVELNVTDKIKKNIETKNINIYDYNKKLTLVAQNMNTKDNKLKFYVEKLGTYVLSDSEIKDSKINKSLVKENTKLDKKINTEIIVIGIFILLLILIIVGYINYKKNKEK